MAVAYWIVDISLRASCLLSPKFFKIHEISHISRHPAIRYIFKFMKGYHKLRTQILPNAASHTCLFCVFEYHVSSPPTLPPSAPSSPNICCCSTMLYTLAFNSVNTRLVLRSRPLSASRISGLGFADSSAKMVDILFKFPSRRAYSSSTSCSSGVRVSAGETDVWLALGAGSEGAGAVDIILCFYWRGDKTV